MRVTLTPNTGDDPKVFIVVGVQLNTAKGELTLTCRDGRVCLGLVGGWEMDVQSTRGLPMGCDDVERLHNGSALVLVN